MPTYNGSGGIPTGIPSGIPTDYSGNNVNQNPFDPPTNIPSSTPVWSKIWGFNGRGYPQFEIPPESYILKRKSSGDTTIHNDDYSLYFVGIENIEQGTLSFGLPSNIVGNHRQTSINSNNNKAIIRAETYLINRYMDYAENVGGLSRSDALIWSENYVRNQGGNFMGAMFLFALGVAIIIIMVG